MWELLLVPHLPTRRLMLLEIVLICCYLASSIVDLLKAFCTLESKRCVIMVNNQRN